jgi:carboxymethylenebutenolidase
MLNDAQQLTMELFGKHMQAELDGDLDMTMSTMTERPHLHNVPSMIGGVGYEGVRQFYKNHLVGKFFPPDVAFDRVSLTVDDKQLVEELVISFTHTVEIEWMLPRIQPTGKKVKVGFVVIVGIKDGKVNHEHIYWDQASVLVQIGLLDPAGLPVAGAESAARILDPELPAKPY